MGKINKKINTILYNMPLNEWVLRKQDLIDLLHEHNRLLYFLSCTTMTENRAISRKTLILLGFSGYSVFKLSDNNGILRSEFPCKRRFFE